MSEAMRLDNEMPPERSTSNRKSNDDEIEHVLESWNHPTHPDRTTPEGSRDFVLPDESTFEEVIRVFRLSYTLDVVENGNPIVSISNGLLEVLKCAKKDALGQRWDHFLEVNQMDTLGDALRTRKTICSNATLTKGKELRKKVLACFVPIFDHNKHIAKYIACFTIEDIEHLSVFEKKVTKLLQACFITDGRGVDMPIMTVTEGFSKLIGFSQAEMFRRSCLSLCGLGTLRSSMRALLHHQHSASVGKTSILLYKKNGLPFHGVVFCFPISKTRVESMKSAELLMVVIDVTAQTSETLDGYILGRSIGAGASGSVRIAKTSTNDEIVAVKTVDASRFRSISEIELVEDEIRALSSVKHDNIINLHEVIFKNHVFHFIMDFAAGGSLAQYLRSKEDHRLEEEEAKTVFCQVVSAMSYCHRRRVVHRDLKPENILLDKDGKIQVADFGLSAIAAPFGNLTTQCGTPEFIAPEVLSSTEYDGAMADIWSLGVILYEILTGNAPFTGRSRSCLFAQIQSGVYHPLSEKLTAHCRDLVDRMLTKDPQLRIIMEEILAHPWIHHSFSNSSKKSLDRALSASQNPVPTETGIGVHESAKLTLGDWDGDDDAISNAIRSGDYSRSPSIVIVQNQSSLTTNQQLSNELEALRLSESEKTRSRTSEIKKGPQHRIMPFFRARGTSTKKSTSKKTKLKKDKDIGQRLKKLNPISHHH